MKKIFILITVYFILPIIIYSQDKPAKLSKSELNTMMNALEKDSLLTNYVNWFGGDPVKLYEEFKTNVRTADSLFRYEQEHISPSSDLGSTKIFEMLPLVDWFTNSDSLTGEPGVAYLIRTDDVTVLFDLGRNMQNTDPSPLLINMNKLGVHIEDIDVIVISHPHSDHLGGSEWSRKNTFSLTAHQLNLGQKQVFTPIPMTYPGLQPIHTPEPTKIANGVATIGVIDCPMFHGKVQEQAIAINVEDKGIVIVSGCGHQTIERILQRSDRLFEEPLYGLLGGFHLPISTGRNISKVYQYFVTNRLPWIPLTATEISNIIVSLKHRGVKIVGISGHDSCDSSIVMFRDAFKESYIDIVVGNKIILN
jgi:7,8-dihydropterin-6-yl-methyl-4-(beta-D-ribofuranosyl)aminobenzene 5'-phosphate synthase